MDIDAITGFFTQGADTWSVEQVADHLVDVTNPHSVTAAQVGALEASDIGTSVQAYDADLTTIAGLGGTKGEIMVHNGTAWVDLGVGTNDHVLTADSGQASGLKWAAAAGGGSGEAVVRNESETAHGFTVGQLVYDNGGTWALAKADAEATSEVLGIVSTSNANDFDLTTQGYVSGLSGLTANTLYFLSDATAGLLTATEPTADNSISKPVFWATSTTTGYFLNYRGAVIGGAASVDVADLANGTDGELITWDAVGAPATVAVGTSGHVLTSNGVGAAPTFQAASGGVDTSGTPVANDFARFTDADTIEGRSYAEVKADLNLEIGTDVQAYSATLDAITGSGSLTLTNDFTVFNNNTIQVETGEQLTLTTGVEMVGGDNSLTLTGDATISGTNTGDESTASVTVPGVVELATTAETTTGTDATRAVTPDGLKDGYQGSTNVTTLGTITTGTWTGTDVAVADGGTGASTASAARTNLDVDQKGTVSRNESETAHGFAVGDLIYDNAGTWTKAKADVESTAEVAGIVSVSNANDFDLVTHGYVTGLTGLTANTLYYLSDATAGLLTSTEPTTDGSVSKPVLWATSTTTGYFLNYRGSVVGSIASATTTVEGIIELATQAEADTGTDTTRAITPAILANHDKQWTWTDGNATDHTMYAYYDADVTYTIDGDDLPDLMDELRRGRIKMGVTVTAQLTVGTFTVTDHIEGHQDFGVHIKGDAGWTHPVKGDFSTVAVLATRQSNDETTLEADYDTILDFTGSSAFILYAGQYLTIEGLLLKGTSSHHGIVANHGSQIHVKECSVFGFNHGYYSSRGLITAAASVACGNNGLGYYATGGGSIITSGITIASSNTSTGFQVEHGSYGTFGGAGSVAQYNGSHGIAVLYGASCYFVGGSGGGFNNNGNYGAYIQEGIMVCSSGTTSKDNTNYGLGVLRGGYVEWANCDISGNTIGVYSQTGGFAYLSGANVSDNTNIGLYCIYGATIIANGTPTIDNNTSYGAYAIYNSYVDVQDGTISDNGTYGCYASWDSFINAYNTTATGTGQTTDYYCSNMAIIRVGSYNGTPSFSPAVNVEGNVLAINRNA